MGKWRHCDIPLAGGHKMRLFLVRDPTRPQMQMEIVGKRLEQVIAKRRPTADVYHRRADGAILIGRQPLLRLALAAGGQPDIKWNQFKMDKHGLQKPEILADLARAAPAGVGEVSWAS